MNSQTLRGSIKGRALAEMPSLLTPHAVWRMRFTTYSKYHPELADEVNLQGLLDQLGDMMGDPGRETGIADGPIPAGFTYAGQFIDHDITLDVQSNLDAATNAETMATARPI